MCGGTYKKIREPEKKVKEPKKSGRKRKRDELEDTRKPSYDLETLFEKIKKRKIESENEQQKEKGATPLNDRQSNGQQTTTYEEMRAIIREATERRLGIQPSEPTAKELTPVEVISLSSDSVDEEEVPDEKRQYH